MSDNFKEFSVGEQLNRMAGVVDKNTTMGGKKSSELDKESFMKMLIEQMKYQDPFNPVKNEQFAQQLTLMSQLEQQVSLNKNMEKMIANQSNSHVAALQIVGKSVIADRAAIFHDKDTITPLKFSLAEEMLDVTLNVVDGNGTPIREIPLGRQSRGNVQTTWDGYLESGFPAETGRYSFTIKGVNMQGKEVNVDTKTEGRVTGVTSAQGKVFLLVGEQKIALDDVQSINEAKEDDKKKTAPAAPASTPQQAIAQVAEKTSEDDKKTSGTENETPRVESRIDDKKLNDLLPLLYR